MGLCGYAVGAWGNLCKANLPLEGQTAAHDQITERMFSVAQLRILLVAIRLRFVTLQPRHRLRDEPIQLFAGAQIGHWRIGPQIHARVGKSEAAFNR